MDIKDIIGHSPLDTVFYDWYTHPEYNSGDNSAFYQHMPTLRLLCADKDVIELGVRYGTSTIGILSARPRSLWSVDIKRFETIPFIESVAFGEKIPFTFTQADDLNTFPEYCHVLFIDTKHNYAQLKAELALWGNYAQEYIIFHDIVSFGYTDEYPDGTDPVGLLPAITEFLKSNTHWSVATYYLNNNGLLVLKRNTHGGNEHGSTQK